MMYQQSDKVRKFNKVCELIMNLAIVNAYWVVFTIVGGILFGIGPSTVSLFSVIRKWLRKENEFSIFKEFKNQYKQNFLSGNILFWDSIMVFVVLVIGFRFYQVQDGLLGTILTYTIGILMLLSGVVLLYIMPSFVHYDVSIKKTIGNAFIIACLNPIQTMLLIAASILIYAIGVYVPGLLVFFGASALSYNLSWIAHQAFRNMEILNGGDENE